MCGVVRSENQQNSAFSIHFTNVTYGFNYTRNRPYKCSLRGVRVCIQTQSINFSVFYEVRQFQCTKRTTYTCTIARTTCGWCSLTRFALLPKTLVVGYWFIVEAMLSLCPLFSSIKCFIPFTFNASHVGSFVSLTVICTATRKQSTHIHTTPLHAYTRAQH